MDGSLTLRVITPERIVLDAGKRHELTFELSGGCDDARTKVTDGRKAARAQTTRARKEEARVDVT